MAGPIGRAVRMSESYKAWAAAHGRDDGPGGGHVAEFGDCRGRIIGRAHPDQDPLDPECVWDVRWEPSGLRYGYTLGQLEFAGGA
jgi:hypothetical protein